MSESQQQRSAEVEHQFHHYHGNVIPWYVRLIDFLHQMGVRNIHVDSDGYVEELLPLWVRLGVTGIFPLEVQAGNDPLRVRSRFPRLQLLGLSIMHRRLKLQGFQVRIMPHRYY